MKGKVRLDRWLNAASVATMIPVSTGVGFFLGYFLDKVFHSQPYLLFLFTLFGIAAGYKNLITFLARMEKREKKEAGEPSKKD